MQIVRATENERKYLFNVLQKYLYELSMYYHDTLDTDGNIAYNWFDSYFEDADREAYLFVDGSQRVGFALLNTHSDLGEDIDHAIAEFTIFPPFRGRGLGARAMDLLLEGRPGSWELTYHRSNESAEAFWHKVCEPYTFEETSINPSETILSFTVHT